MTFASTWPLNQFHQLRFTEISCHCLTAQQAHTQVLDMTYICHSRLTERPHSAEPLFYLTAPDAIKRDLAVTRAYAFILLLYYFGWMV